MHSFDHQQSQKDQFSRQHSFSNSNNNNVNNCNKNGNNAGVGSSNFLTVKEAKDTCNLYDKYNGSAKIASGTEISKIKGQNAAVSTLYFLQFCELKQISIGSLMDGVLLSKFVTKYGVRWSDVKDGKTTVFGLGKKTPANL